MLVTSYKLAPAGGRLKGGGIASRRGTIFEMQRVLARNTPNATFGGTLPNGKFFDYRLGNLFTEFKSTNNVYDKIAVKDFDQFTGYLQEISSIDKLEYVFHKEVLKHAHNLTDSQVLIHIKNEMKRVFTDKSSDIFNTIWNNQALRQNMFGNRSLSSAQTYFNTLKSNTSSSLYSFIKAE